ncbi:MAG: low affinity iron permease family protein, partial [Chloroflexia bacterium]
MYPPQRPQPHPPKLQNLKLRIRNSELGTRRANMGKIFTTFSKKASHWTGHPLAFLIAFAVVIIWGVTGPLFAFSDTWQL